MNKSLRRQLYFLKTLVSPKRAAAPSNETIDVVIPVIEKDLAILPLCLEGVRSCVTNPVGTIYIVAPSTPAIREFAVAHQCTFVDENEVFGWGVGAIQYRVNGANRAGWIFQQLLKLAGTIAQTEHFLVIDADHILIHPHTFLTQQGKTVFYQSREFHLPYYRNIRKLMSQYHIKDIHFSTLSYVDHKMLFSKSRLNQLHEKLGGPEKWQQAIINSLDANELSSFSEYELYGSYTPSSVKITKPWRNKNLRYEMIMSLPELQKKYGYKYCAITFPEYINK